MSKEWLERAELLYHTEGLDHLNKTTVMVCGVGGVGSFALEALVRSGIGTFLLVDHDRSTLNNMNRQLLATIQTVGEIKVELAKKRIAEINPEATVYAIADFFQGDLENFLAEHGLENLKIDYIIDAIDSVRAKTELIASAHRLHIPIISAMGAGNKFDPTRFKVGDLFKTSYDPIAKVLRRNLRKLNIKHHKVVFSEEIPKTREHDTTIGSTAFVPPVCGMICASVVVRDLLQIN